MSGKHLINQLKIKKMQYYYFVLSAGNFRCGTRGGFFVVDQTLTALGWDGVSPTDWINVWSVSN